MTLRFDDDPARRFALAKDVLSPGAQLGVQLIGPVRQDVLHAEPLVGFKDYVAVQEYAREKFRAELVGMVKLVVRWTVYLSHVQRAHGFFMLERELSAVEQARADLAEMRKTLFAMYTSDELARVKDHVKEAHTKLAWLSYYFDLQCRHCGKPVELGYNCCAGCADERGP